MASWVSLANLERSFSTDVEMARAAYPGYPELFRAMRTLFETVIKDNERLDCQLVQTRELLREEEAMGAAEVRLLEDRLSSVTRETAVLRQLVATTKMRSMQNSLKFIVINAELKREHERTTSLPVPTLSGSTESLPAEIAWVVFQANRTTALLEATLQDPALQSVYGDAAWRDVYPGVRALGLGIACYLDNLQGHCLGSDRYPTLDSLPTFKEYAKTVIKD